MCVDPPLPKAGEDLRPIVLPPLVIIDKKITQACPATVPFKEFCAPTRNRRNSLLSAAPALVRLSTVALLATIAPAAGENLCRPPQTPIFACRMAQTPGARIASLCADKGQKPWRLTYRFGTPGQIELTYPAPGEPAAFRHAIISYASLGGDAVLFTRGPITYALFYVLGQDTDFDGVAVRKGNAEVANLSCAPGALDELTTDFFNSAGLPRESSQFAVPNVFFERYEKHRR